MSKTRILAWKFKQIDIASLIVQNWFFDPKNRLLPQCVIIKGSGKQEMMKNIQFWQKQKKKEHKSKKQGNMMIIINNRVVVVECSGKCVW